MNVTTLALAELRCCWQHVASTRMHVAGCILIKNPPCKGSNGYCDAAIEVLLKVSPSLMGSLSPLFAYVCRRCAYLFVVVIASWWVGYGGAVVAVCRVDLANDAICC